MHFFKCDVSLFFFLPLTFPCHNLNFIQMWTWRGLSLFSASTHTLWFSFVPQKVSVLFFKTQVMKGGTGLGRGAAIEKGSQRKELQDVPECVSPLSKYRQRQDGERAPDSRKMPSAIQSLPRQHGPRAQSARVHTHTHTHTHFHGEPCSPIPERICCFN